MSTGLERLAAAGKNFRSSVLVFSESSGTTNPPASHASVHKMPGPPAFVTMATRLP